MEEITRYYTEEITSKNKSNHLKSLIELKEIISSSLSSIKKTDIIKHLFSRNSVSLILKNSSKNQILGGVNLKIFFSKNLIEICYICVKFEERRNGFGNYLMKAVKNYASRNEFETVLTFADQTAIRFFEKNGFVEELDFGENDVKEILRSYDYATLMQFKVNIGIDYFKIDEKIKYQREILREIIFKKTIEKKSKKNFLKFFLGEFENKDYLINKDETTFVKRKRQLKNKLSSFVQNFLRNPKYQELFKKMKETSSDLDLNRLLKKIENWNFKSNYILELRDSFLNILNNSLAYSCINSDFVNLVKLLKNEVKYEVKILKKIVYINKNLN